MKSPPNHGRWRCWPALAACCLALPAWAQPPRQPSLSAMRQVRVAATEDRLWLVRVDDGHSALSYRTPAGPWVSGQPLSAPVASIASAGAQAYAFLNDGSFYRYADAWLREKDLPDRRHALHMIGVEGALYALVESTPAALLPVLDPDTLTPTTRPFDPGNAPLSIVRYDTRGWAVVAACPAVVSAQASPGLTPRLCARSDQLLLFWMSSGPPPQIHYARLSLPAGRWDVSSGTLGIPHLASFWPLVVNRAVVLLACVSEPEGQFKLRAYRLVESQTPAGDEWEPAQPQLSPLPENMIPAEYAEAFAFNQHFGVLVTTAAADVSPAGSIGKRAYLQFGRFDGPPAMQTFDVHSQPAHAPTTATVRMLQAFAVLAILVVLFTFYRGNIAKAVTLPPGWEPAFTSQRLLGCAIDLLPFTLASAIVLHVSWLDAWRQMTAWAFHPELGGTGLPERPYLLWWLLSAGGYTTYSLILELVTRRTIGKVLTRTHLLSQAGTTPAAWQILVRNASRFVEILPPFWILGFLVVLSRNRQRAGDLFAQTLSVRTAPPPHDQPGPSSPDN